MCEARAFPEDGATDLLRGGGNRKTLDPKIAVGTELSGNTIIEYPMAYSEAVGEIGGLDTCPVGEDDDT